LRVRPERRRRGRAGVVAVRLDRRGLGFRAARGLRGLLLGGARLFRGGASLVLGGLAGGLLGGAGLFLRPLRGLRLQLLGDRRVVLGAEVDLLRGALAGVAVGLQIMFALERLDLLDGHFELVGDPRVRTTLSHPATDLVKLRTQRPAAHAGRESSEPVQVQAPWQVRSSPVPSTQRRLGQTGRGNPSTQTC